MKTFVMQDAKKGGDIITPEQQKNLTKFMVYAFIEGGIRTMGYSEDKKPFFKNKEELMRAKALCDEYITERILVPHKTSEGVPYLRHRVFSFEPDDKNLNLTVKFNQLGEFNHFDQAILELNNYYPQAKGIDIALNRVLDSATATNEPVKQVKKRGRPKKKVIEKEKVPNERLNANNEIKELINKKQSEIIFTDFRKRKENPSNKLNNNNNNDVETNLEREKIVPLKKRKTIT